MVLEMTGFQWNIEDVLSSPEQELDAVISLKAAGEKIRKQTRNRASSESEETI